MINKTFIRTSSLLKCARGLAPALTLDCLGLDFDQDFKLARLLRETIA